MPFVDGEPIDASKLGALETQLNELKATMPKIGVSQTVINTPAATSGNPSVSNSGTVVPGPTPPKIYGNITQEVSLTSNSYKTFPIDYSAAGLTAKPQAIILTPISPAVKGTINQASVLTGSITATGATGQIYHRSDATPVKVKYYFLVISF
jgi:hypothetical protein